MTSTTGSYSTTTAARDEHATHHFLSDGDTPEKRAAMAQACGLCARIWNPATGGFRAEESARVTPRVERDYSRPGRPVIDPQSPPPIRNQRAYNDAAAATEAQLSYIKGLIAKRDTATIAHRIHTARAEAVAHTFTKSAASDLIGLLKTMPLVGPDATSEAPAPTAPPVARKPWPKVAEGYYALSLTDLEGTGFINGVNFFHVTRPTEGRFAGRTFLSILASDAHHKVYGDLARAVLEGIAADPHAAQMLFAKESKHCYRCNRRLTDDESRAAGMGPTCRSL